MNDFAYYYNYANDYNNNYNKSVKNNSKYNNLDLDPYDGFIKGNLFDNLYVPYMNYKPREINPANEKEYYMLMVQAYFFAAHDLQLYLDVNPNDSDAIKLRNKYYDMYMEAKAQYESKYGPIDISSDLLNNNPWMWDSNVWPWEGNK